MYKIETDYMHLGNLEKSRPDFFQIMTNCLDKGRFFLRIISFVT